MVALVPKLPSKGFLFSALVLFTKRSVTMDFNHELDSECTVQDIFQIGWHLDAALCTLCLLLGLVD